jgi:hypothetical protein
MLLGTAIAYASPLRSLRELPARRVDTEVADAEARP